MIHLILYCLFIIFLFGTEFKKLMSKYSVYDGYKFISTRGLESLLNIKFKTVRHAMILTPFTAAEFRVFTCSLAECI